MKADFLTAGRLFTVLLLWFVVLRLDAQAVSYNYDFSGNRISRQVITLSSPSQGARSQPADSVTVVATIGERRVSVYPNPTKGTLGVDITGGDAEESIRLLLFNGQGILLYTAAAAQGMNVVEMSAYPKGWYVLRVQAANTRQELKIIKE